ncbi:MAG: hypothetical protein ABI792_06410, partial [bacterium]
YYQMFVLVDDIPSVSKIIKIESGSITGFGTLNLTAIIQGFYNSSTDTMVSDTMKVYLRNFTSPYSKVDSSVSMLDSSGAGVFNFGNITNGTNYYLVVKHRNSIETWSSVAMSFTAGTMTYSFNTAADKAYGKNQIQVDNSPLRFAVYGGDVNNDGIVNLNDIINVSNSAINFVSGYVNTDMTGDNFVNLTDLILTQNNSVKFVRKVTP